MGIDPTALANPSIDIISEHYYSPWATAISDVGQPCVVLKQEK
jgi:hypothetical protein